MGGTGGANHLLVARPSLSLTLTAFVVTACASYPDVEGERLLTDIPPVSCVPNQRVRCLCGLDEGVQSCTAGGTLSPCECAGASSTALGDDGAKLEACGGAEPTTLGPEGARRSGNLASARRDLRLGCGADTIADHVYAFEADASGALVAEATGAFEGVVAVRVGDCGRVDAEAACVPGLGQARARVTRGDQVFVIVAATARPGTYALALRIVQ